MRYRLIVSLLLTSLLAGGNAAAQSGITINGSVYGGGNLADVGGSVTVNMRTGTVVQDVYGGGALANTNNCDPNDYEEVSVTVGMTVVTGYYTKSGNSYTEITQANQKAVSGTTYYKKGKWVTVVTTNKTEVNLLGGTIKGNVYGGGLGRQAVEGKEAVGTEGEPGYVPAVEAVTGVAAIVYGDVTVTLDGTKMVSHFTGTGDDRMADAGQIFGCNNLNGTPKGHVKVHVKRTVDSAKPTVDGENHKITRDQRKTYDVAAVYGGGNQADYEPIDAFLDPAVAGNPAKIAAAFAEVLIEGCDKTSIEYVYGGGNAAAVPATEVTVKGTYIIDYLFGGGNGKSTSTYTNPGADVGIIDKTAHAANSANGNYGTGKAVTKLIGGMIHVVFGGSNTLGNVRGGTEVSMPESDGTGDCCTTLDVREIYGAGQNAGQEGGVNLILGCVEGLQNVYGGARNANIAGGVNLTVTSGTFENVFGGNDVAGTIQGPITLNIEETACDPIIINNLYLGGNQAAYSIYGYYDENGTLKPRTATDTETAKPHVGSTAVPYANPVLNVISCTRIDNVFGGGYGATAVMYGSPTVNINMIPGDHASSITRATSATDSDTKKAHYLGAIGNVFGGGNLAAVVGNTTVNIGQSEYVEMTSYDKTDVRDYYTRTGSAGSYTYTLVGGDNAVAATPGTSYYKKVEGAYITGSVYGGGNQANVTGNTAVNVCAVNSDDPSTAGVVEFTAVSISGANFEGVTIEGAVFGAGKGVNTSVSAALVSGNTIVGMAGGEVKQSVYGGGELSQVGGNTFVTVTSGTIGTAGMGAATHGNVYGGGLGATDDIRFGLIKGNTYVNINNIVADATYAAAHDGVNEGDVVSSPTILHNIYGGGAYGSVGTYTYETNDPDAVILGLQTQNTGIATVTVTGGTIGTTGQNNGMVFGSSRGDVGAPNAIHDRLAWTYDTHVTIGTSGQGTTSPTINGSVYGGGENGHNYHDAEVIIHSGTIGIYEAGSALNATRGNVYGAGCGTDKYYSDSYEGTITNPTDGNGDKYNPLAGVVYGDVTVTMDGGVVKRNVYGAGAMGSVGKFTKDNTGVITFASGGTTTIAISGGTVGVNGNDNGNVFGAARGDKAFTDKDLALVKETGVTISSTAVIKGNVYGGGEVGNVHTNTAVNVQGGTIAKNVFGGGKGVEDLFTCEQAMVGAEGDGACQDPDDDENINKGTIVTISNGTVGTLDANNNNQLVVGTGNVYGGGEIGRVEWNTQVTIGDAAGTNTPYIYGSVFGAGKGLETHGYSALVRGNSTVTVQGKAKVGHNVYGGGEKSTVGRYWVKDIPATPCDANETQPTAPAGLPTGMPYQQRSGGKCRVYIQGSADIGYNGAAIDKGHVFGAGKGVEPHFTAGTTERMVNNNNGGSLVPFADETNQTTGKTKTAEELYLEFLQTLALVTNTYVTIDGSAKVKGNVYGGSESGFVQHDTNVTILSSNCEIGTVSGTTSSYGNVFGGGKGLEEFAEAGKVKGNTTVAISNGTMNGNVYGGGELGDVGIIDKTATDKDGNLSYNYAWKQTDGTTANTPHNNVPSDTSHDTSKNTGICTVTITGGTIGSASASTANHASGHVFGAGKGSEITWWCEKAIAFATNVSVSGSTVVYGTVYGGGQVGRVEDDARVIIGTANDPGSGSKPDIRGDVFGAGAGLATHGYSALLRGNTQLTVQGIAKVGGNVYGGGETASVGKFTVVGGLPSKPDTGGTCTVTIQDGATIGASGTSNHVFGACKGVNPATITNTNRKSMQLWTNRPKGDKDVEGTYWDYYKVYPNGYTGTKFVWVYYTEDEYPAFLRTLALTSNTNVTIDENSTVNGSVYGGGERGVTLGTVVVNMNGGTVNQDVYGGGALADTNTGNWDVHGYVEVSVSPGTSVAGLYTRTGTEYELTEDVTAQNGTTYYRQEPTWADANRKSALYTTTVNLLGGEIHGDAYGGGLGQRNGFNGATSSIAAQVYGDVNVVLGTEKGVESPSATAFNITHYADDQSTTDFDESTIIKSGRVFGCNNLNGSPKGDVTVTVWRTVAGTLDGNANSRTPETKKKLKEGADGYVPHTYEVAAVYGGGNLADFTAIETGKKAYVIIETCDVSIETVYGGGNAAEVPGTNVLVKGAYEINEVFGGGNGSDPYTTDGGTNWVDNPGANIGNASQGGNATTLLTGGLIHAAYGGSNKKGTVYGSVSIDIGTGGDCTLDLEKMVGAGKDADVNGDLIMVLGCKPGNKIPVVYGGADNAHVNGNIELTITSGNYENVFGGNNEGGFILGHIKLNIEERDCDTPITIDHLYLGGNQAPYSMYGYYNAGTAEAPNYQPRTAEMADPDNANHKDDLTTIAGMDVRRQPDGTTHSYAQPELNIISCTYIGEVFGGGYGTRATIYGDPIVNINMVPGPKAATNITRNSGGNAHALGEIHDVFGGGNEAAVEGNTTVNIGTATTVTLTSVEDDPATEAHENVQTVEGAYITGNVYGGGNEADVKGNTYVNVCAYKNDDNTTTDVIEYSGVTISGTDFEGVTIKGDVFGGGKGVTEAAGVTGAFECAKAMVGNNGDNDVEKNEAAGIDITKESTDKGTRVSIGNGTIEGNVYGGGQIGRVEWNGVVTIGLPIGQNETSAPVIGGDVFGAGKGVEQYGYAALLRGNTFVTIQANAKVGHSVYGGGEIASVGRYKVATQDDIDDDVFMAAHPGIEKGMPYSLANEESGYCNVIVRGNAEIGPDDMKMYNATTGKPDDDGHVFGAGKGILPYENTFDECPSHSGKHHPGRVSKGDVWECYNGEEAKYLRFIETQALATHTEVLIDGNAFIKGSVYGGSLSGHVQHDTHVTITGDCQIGAGFKNGQSLAKYTNWPTGNITESWDACAHWEFDENDDAPYDPYAIHQNPEDSKWYYDSNYTEYANGGSKIAKNGQTYYGNVFGGGSGVVPYKPGLWHREAGSVGGNTVVDITGGHILTSVYGGNECTDVGTYDPSNRNLLAGTGKCTVNMIGGTVGVPRIKKDIEDHPMISCVYGGGKGDSRVNFNKWTNVGETEVNITKNARIYGSVFGGGEDGHVLGDAETNIGGSVTIGTTTHTYSNVIIGSQGQSGADGNIFGGGRGFSEDALTAGVVCGNVRLNIHNGKMLGTVYGGGRLASVGTHLADADTDLYGKLIPEGYNQVIGSTDVAATDASHGIINITIDGGTIGATDSDGKLLTSDYSIGDVFGGCKGAGSDKRFGLAKKTTITMTAGTNGQGGTVNGNVYGGGELGYVGEATLNSSNVYEWKEESAGGGLCTVGISGGTVKGHVFGAGKGLADDFDCEKALVRTTSVTINKSGSPGTTVNGNVYGGGEIGRVDQNTVVTIGNSASDGAGTEGGTDAVISGNVFGAGAGVETHGYSALVRGNATVTIQGNASVGQNVYGGGMIASVGQYGLDSNFMPETLKGGGDCIVTVKGRAVIGASGEGHVFGAGQGVNPFDAAHNYIDYTDSTDKTTKPKRMTRKPDDPTKLPALYTEIAGTNLIWEYYTSQENYFKFLQTLALATDSYATVEGNASVHGSVYGGSESGFVQRETNVVIQGSSKILTVTDNNTTTDGNVFGGGRGVSGFDKAGRVRGNATTTIGGSSTVNGNIYGGGELGFVGKFSVSPNGRNYDWQKITNQAGTEEETGTCTVIVNSATAEIKGDVFGAGKGEAITFKCEPAMTRTTSVSISAGTVGGNVYGGGEVGRVDQDTEVTIGAATGDSAPHITGSVFGAGAGVGTHGYSALVRGNTYVTVQNHATVGHSVYGGGEIASVGKYGLDPQKMPSVLLGGGYCYVTVKGDAEITKDVFGAGQGITPAFDKTNADRSQRSRRMTMYNSDDFPSAAMLPATGEATGTTTQNTTWEYYESGSPYVWEYFQEESDYLTYLETLALATHPEVTIEGNASIGEDVYGGGERGITKGTVIVNINGGTITRDVYGGGALANTNTTSTVGDEDYDTGVVTTSTVHPTTTVNLHGGIIGHNVYGGGLGEKPSSTNTDGIAALVYGNVLVELNKATATDNCVIKGVLHGANNYNGSPLKDVTVHVYKTQGWTDDKGTPDNTDDVSHDVTTQKANNATRTNTVYELKAVYGGGNEATYDPDESDDEKHKAHVIIDGCDLTSIETVYGGGNAASAPATHVEVNSCYEIGTVFGGGNGKDPLGDGTENPGAHVGYKADGTTAYGTGIALAELFGGTIHQAFGGSNTKGNVRTSGTVTLDEADPNGCPLCIEEVYGAGNEADQDGTSNINLGCLSYLREMYGGAKNADINNDIELTIQSGRFDRVFGGNNLGGDIKGTITVNIEETGCHPIIIGQLFGGGNQAAYTAPSGKHGPTVNVKSFTSIGEIYGGGFGASALIHGDTYVNINECVGDNATEEISETAEHTGWTHYDIDIYDPETGDLDETKTITLEQPTHDSGAIGTIGNVFGGGNEAPVDGNTNVTIGNMEYVEITTNIVAGETDVRGYYTRSGEGTTGSPYVYTPVPSVLAVANTIYYDRVLENNVVTYVAIDEANITIGETDVSNYYTCSGEGTEDSPYEYTSLIPLAEANTHYYKKVVGANIIGNVYGGGNAADVSGDTNVVIGREMPSGN